MRLTDGNKRQTENHQSSHPQLTNKGQTISQTINIKPLFSLTLYKPRKKSHIKQTKTNHHLSCQSSLTNRTSETIDKKITNRGNLQQK